MVVTSRWHRRQFGFPGEVEAQKRALDELCEPICMATRILALTSESETVLDRRAPHPIPNLRKILAILFDVLFMFDELVLELLL
jgi:hypothetical protein